MSFIDQLRVEKNLLKESISFWLKLRKFNASSHTEKDIEKTQYVLSRLVHTIEKGMSMRTPRKGFGQQKVLSILGKLIDYANNFASQDRDFLQYPINALYSYINYTKSCDVDIPEIESKFNELLEISKLKPESHKGGVVLVKKEFVDSACKLSFKDLLENRHSVRYFKDKIPEISTVNKALELAQRTPSACNRQGWKTHVFLGAKSVELIKWQGGARGFEYEVKGAILVTANLKAFLFYEVHQAYIDGGLYAMNLINALQCSGFGTIPLSVGFIENKLKLLRNFNIPENEVPIVVIGFGYCEDQFNVAISERKKLNVTNTMH